MNVITPLTIRTSELTSSTVAYPDAGETAWSSAAVAYAVGQTVSYLTEGLIHKFECKTAHTSSASNFPAPYPNETSNWLDLGAVNRFNMFHLERNTQTIAASPLVVEISPDAHVGAVGLGKVEADSAKIEVYDGSTLIYTSTQDLIDRTVASWYDYFYLPFRQIENTIFYDLPILKTAKIKVTLTKATGSVKVGFCVLGVPFNIGETQYKATARLLNFSEISRDAFGEAKITKRRSIPKTSQVVVIEKENLNKAIDIFKQLNAEVALWYGISNPLDGYFNSVFIIGVYKDIEFSMELPKHVFASLELEQI